MASLLDDACGDRRAADRDPVDAAVESSASAFGISLFTVSHES
jgi:hypothetical protein